MSPFDALVQYLNPPAPDYTDQNDRTLARLQGPAAGMSLGIKRQLPPGVKVLDGPYGSMAAAQESPYMAGPIGRLNDAESRLDAAAAAYNAANPYGAAVGALPPQPSGLSRINGTKVPNPTPIRPLGTGPDLIGIRG